MTKGCLKSYLNEHIEWPCLDLFCKLHYTVPTSFWLVLVPDLASKKGELLNFDHPLESLTEILQFWTAYLEVLLQLLLFSEFLEVATCLGLLPLLGKLSVKKGAGWRDGGETVGGRDRIGRDRERKSENLDCSVAKKKKKVMWQCRDMTQNIIQYVWTKKEGKPAERERELKWQKKALAKRKRVSTG